MKFFRRIYLKFRFIFQSRERRAAHEAGHTIVAMTCQSCHSVRSVDIKFGLLDKLVVAGLTMIDMKIDHHNYAAESCLIHASGAAGEMFKRGRVWWAGCAKDLSNIFEKVVCSHPEQLAPMSKYNIGVVKNAAVGCIISEYFNRIKFHSPDWELLIQKLKAEANSRIEANREAYEKVYGLLLKNGELTSQELLEVSQTVKRQDW